ncbi:MULTISPECIES: DUF742 domain-containing protein [Micromonospora]|jgi:hypothetical protein|uniref:DUF742 domain-containing protein n=1 Tax=Micromonospora sicca TaxID=2202420 RepID=A0A317DJG0_9ACTN|nr:MULTISPECIES: DUF742 domain-containing protein [unclassified Micromonospora]MBM0226729.1 DUF742 domain-containing protein [Micromonospora sp. ATA51]MDZ5444087.1 DUF742 domain-containing protein [Micromonospora sp. 4G57]MDZ5493248.1 DUF742 domain-containing protein [Micromonospora sp. 4G53]PWR14370.1 DUF742 domain-containing protein [Micromonospora sp. 4G51]
MTVQGDSAEQEWVDDHAGPVVRPYAVTRGRARPVTGTFDLISLVMATRADVASESGLGPEHVAIVGLCQRMQSVAEIAAHLDLPVGTVRVLLGDLVARNLVQVREPRATTAGLPDDSVFEAVINGLRAL